MLCCSSPYSECVQYKSNDNNYKSSLVLVIVWFRLRTFKITSKQLQTGVYQFKPGLHEWYNTGKCRNMNIIFSDQQELDVDENTLETWPKREEMKYPCLPSVDGWVDCILSQWWEMTDAHSTDSPQETQAVLCSLIYATCFILIAMC